MGVPHVTLTTQRRMHPQISSLITPVIYKFLKDADSVKYHPEIRGIRDRLFFINHSIAEDGQASTWGINNAKANLFDVAGFESSKTNSHEANYLAKLLEYLLLNGYRSSQIVVLSMYKAQVNLIRRISQQLASSGSR